MKITSKFPYTFKWLGVSLLLIGCGGGGGSGGAPDASDVSGGSSGSPSTKPLPGTALPDASQAALDLPASVANGSTVELECGRLYRGTLDLNGKSNVSVRTTGSCGKAVITPGSQISGWTRHQGNIWVAPISFDAAQVIIDGRPATKAHWPSKSQTWATSSGTSANSLSYAMPNGDLAGATLVFRQYDWSIEARQITGYSGNTISFTSTGNSAYYNLPPTQQAVSFYVEGKLWMLDEADEWAVSNGRLYVWAADGQSPEGRTWASPNMPGINAANSTGVSVDNVRIYGASDGIGAQGARNLRVTNSEIVNSSENGIFNTGGSGLVADGVAIRNTRHNAIYVRWGGGNEVIRNSSFDSTGVLGMPTNSNGAVTLTLSPGATVANNTVSNSGYIGIRVFENSTVSGNTIQDSTYAGIFIEEPAPNISVTYASNTIINAGSSNVTFASTLNSSGGSRSLTVNSTGTTTFGGAVGASSALSSLTTNAGGSTLINGGAVRTTGNQTYGDAVTLGADTALNAGTGAITFGNTLNGAFNLTTTTTGNTTFTGAVGSTTPLNTLTVTNANNLSFSTTLATSGDVTQTAGNGTTTFRGASIGGALNVTTNNITLATAAVTTIGPVGLYARTTITLNAALTSNTGSLTLTADTDGNNSGTVTSNSSGDITAAAAGASVTISGADAMNLAGAITTTGGQVTITNTDNAGGTITRSSDPITTNGGQVVLNAPDGITLSAANADVATGGGAFTVNADTDADGTGTYSQSNSGSAVTTSGGAVVITADDINLAGTINSGAGSTSIFSSNAQTIGLGATAGGMTISGTELQNITATGLTIGNAVNLSITVNGITAANSNNISGTVTLKATGTGQDVNFGVGPSVFNALVANADNNINVTGAVTTDIGGLGLIAANGTVNLGANITTASGATATISAGAGANQTAGTLSATNLLLLGAGTFSLNQAGNDVTTLAADLNAGSLSFTDADDLAVGTVSGVVGIATGFPAPGGGVTLTAANGLTINQAINTTAGSGGNVNISNDVMVNAALTAGAGNITLDGGTGSGNDVVVNLGGSVTSSGGGTITIYSPDMLLLAGLLDAPAAAIDLTAGSGMVSLGGNVLTADLNLTSGPSGIVLDTDVATLTALAANSDITIRQSNGLALNTVDAGAGNVVIILAAGALVDNNGPAANITGNILSLLAPAGIGSAADLLDTNVNFLEADGGSGGVYLANAQSLTIILTGVVATAGNIDLGSVGALTVDANVLTPGDIVLTANESLPGAAGDDLRVNSALVRAGGSATFQTGDGLNFTSGSTIQAGITITVTADFGNNDPLGSLITVAGTMLAPRLDLFCGPDTDLVTIFPSAATPIYAHGGDPGGNALFVDLTGISSAALTLYTPTSGLWTFANRQLLWYVDFIAAWNPDANVIVVDDEGNDSLLFSWPILGYSWGPFGIGLTAPTALAVGGSSEAGELGTSSPFSLLPASQAGFSDPSKLVPQARETISGIVFLDNNKDGLPGRGETRLAGVVLVLERLEGGVWVPVTSTRSGSSGEFIFSGLRPSQFRVRPSADGQRGLDNLTIQTNGSGGARVHSPTSTSFDGAISYFQPEGKLPSQETLDRIFSAWGQADQDLDVTSAAEFLATADNMLDNAWTPLAAAGVLGVASLPWDRYSRRRRLSVPAPGNTGNNDD